MKEVFKRILINKKTSQILNDENMNKCLFSGVLFLTSHVSAVPGLALGMRGQEVLC